MIIDCIADLHGHYPTLAGGDLLIVAGDLTAHDISHERHVFLQWLAEQDYRKKVWIGGNHDNSLVGLTFTPTRHDAAEYLCDSGTEFQGLKIWGSPWSLTFDGINPRCTAFTGTEEDLKKKYDMIPDDIDILITHGPPYGIRDEVLNWHTGKAESVGSKSLMTRVQDINPKYHIFGHIHEGYGTYESEDKYLTTKFINCSHVNELYEPVNKPVRIIL